VREPKRFHVYIMTNGPRSHVLYTGVTGNLSHRVFQHKNKLVPGFSIRCKPHAPRLLRAIRVSRRGDQS